MIVVAGSAGAVAALDAADGAMVWSRTFAGGVRATPMVSNEEVAVATLGGTLTSLGLADGAIIWQRAFGGAKLRVAAARRADVAHRGRHDRRGRGVPGAGALALRRADGDAGVANSPRRHRRPRRLDGSHRGQPRRRRNERRAVSRASISRRARRAGRSTRAEGCTCLLRWSSQTASTCSRATRTPSSTPLTRARARPSPDFPWPSLT